MDNINKYTMRVEWSEEDECFLAKCLEFPSLITHGETRTKALEELETVINESTDWMIEDGENIPEPLSSKNYKGNISLRIPNDTHKEVAILATEKNVSLNQYLTSLIEKNLYSDQINTSISELKNTIKTLTMEMEAIKIINYTIISKLFMVKNDPHSTFKDDQGLESDYNKNWDSYLLASPEKECDLIA